MKCTFVNCANEGEPSDGFNFYACDGCLETLETMLTELASAQQTRN